MAAASSSPPNPSSRGPGASGGWTDIACPRADQPAMLQLFNRMRDPADGARHRKQHQFMAGRQAQRMYQHRERIVDIDEFTGRLRDAFRYLVGQFALCTRARQSLQQRLRPGVAMLVDAVAKTRKTL